MQIEIEDRPIDYFDRLSVALRICRLRRKLGLNQEEFADLLGVQQGTVSRWETCRRFPNVDIQEDIWQLNKMV